MKNLAAASVILMKVLPLLALVLLLPQAFASSDDQRPLILIYPGISSLYGKELQMILEEDGRMDAEIQVVDSADVFRMMLYFPSVKVAVISLPVQVGENLGPALEWFFSNGGGLVALGMAAMKPSIGNASETVFPTFATTYRTGMMDRKIRKFVMTHIKEMEDEISQGISNFTVFDHKIALSFDLDSRSYAPRIPESGDYKVLFRESGTGAPSIIKYEDEGVSVTFASFGGVDYETGPGYYKDFSETLEFKTLFSNSVYWVWSNERKYEKHMQQAVKYYQDREMEINRLIEEAKKRVEGANSWRIIRTVITLLIAAVACIGVYWATFLRSPKID